MGIARGTQRGKSRRGGGLIIFSVIFGGLLTCVWPTLGWATTKLGNAELQAWYRQRHTFHTNGGKDFNWVQWRNEVFGWFVYDDLVKNGRLLDTIEVPFIKGATFNARYRFRADPIYSIRKHYRNLYDSEERESMIFPENGLRDAFVDLDFGHVGPGRLSVRIGNQQIVWGESDLFRSIDIVNPLRIDQNQAVGEKFDEFRSPSWAVKFLYDVGNVGSWFSGVGIEAFWNPRFRTGVSDLLLESAWDIPYNIEGCLDERNQAIAYDRVRCADARSASGERVFQPRRPNWIGSRRVRNPWSLFAAGTNPRNVTPDHVCFTQRCSPDVSGDRASLIPNLRHGQFQRDLGGAFGKAQAVGMRVSGSSIWGIDFSLIYMFLPSGPTGSFDYSTFTDKATKGLRSDIYYGDADTAASMGFPTPSGSFAEGLRRCLSDGGKNNETKSKDRGAGVATILVGADLLGYNDPQRFNSNNRNGALGADGNPLPGRHNSARPPVTFCLPAQHNYFWTHVIGFTLTYNDFDYTGAVFRAEQSFTTKELMRALPAGAGRRFGEVIDDRTFENDIDKYTGVWRSMVGFDLFQSLQFFKYVPFLHHSFHQQAWFISGQWLMENYWNNVANNLCLNVDNGGNGLTEEEAAAETAAGFPAYSNPGCQRHRWNHLFTLSASNQGLFGSRLEMRNAIVFEPRDQQHLLFSQWWWRNVFGNPALELSAGVAWYTGSGMGEGWSGLHNFADRDQLWLEWTYYLL